MANKEHLNILKRGVKEWNEWIEKNPQEKPDLKKADLKGANLTGANLTGANLTKAKLIKANLTEANLTEANLTEADLTGVSLLAADLISTILKRAYLKRAYLMAANLTGADLTGADLTEANLKAAILTGAQFPATVLKGATISEYTSYEGIEDIDIKFGINGFYCESTNSAALMTIYPSGDSMQGPNPDAVVESLKRSRSLHFYSLTLAGIALLILILGINAIKPPFLSDIPVSSVRFVILALPISAGVLSLVKLFMQDALKGIQYLQDQKSAMTVGNFPWILSKYAGTLRANKIQSLITRIVMAFHPLVYLYFFIRWDYFLSISNDKLLLGIGTLGIVLLVIIGVILLYFCIYIFILSQRFQKPILFDPETEKTHKSNLEKLTTTIQDLKSKFDELISLQQQKQEEKPKPNNTT